MIMMNAVTDIAGLNRISKQVLANAAHAAAGLARGYEATKSQAQASKPLVAVSMFGVTTPGVMRIREQLESNGFEVVTFHAVGEGAGMEALIDAGAIDALIDYTLPEIINHWNSGIFDPGVERMEAAVAPASRWSSFPGRPSASTSARATRSRRSSTPTSATSSSTTPTSPRCWRPPRR